MTLERGGVTAILAAGALLGAIAGLVRASRRLDGGRLRVLGRCLDHGMTGAGAGMALAVLVLALAELFAQLS